MYPFLLESVLADKVLIPMYGLFLALAFSLSYVQSVVGAMRLKLDPKHIENLFLVIVVSSVIGSRGFHVLFENFSYFRERPIEMFYFWQGGFTFYGALLLAMLSAVSYAFYSKLDIPKYCDIAAIAIIVGLIVGRLGCFLAGCCWGHPTTMPWGVSFTHPHTFASPRGVPLHPTQLYESFLCIGIYLHLLRQINIQKYDGQITVHAMAMYATARIFVEAFRGDSYRGFLFGGWVSTSQFISALLLILAFGLSRYWEQPRERASVRPSKTKRRRPA